DSLTLASLNHACRDHGPTFPQPSPPSLLTTAACGGLRSAPDCRTRRALLHLPYSCASPCGRAMLVTQDPSRTLAVCCDNCFSPYQSTCFSGRNAVGWAWEPVCGDASLLCWSAAPQRPGRLRCTRSCRREAAKVRLLGATNLERDPVASGLGVAVVSKPS